MAGGQKLSASIEFTNYHVSSFLYQTKMKKKENPTSSIEIIITVCNQESGDRSLNSVPFSFKTIFEELKSMWYCFSHSYQCIFHVVCTAVGGDKQN